MSEPIDNKRVMDFCIERVLQMPVPTHAFMELLLAEGVELNLDHNKLSHEERVALIREIIYQVALREITQ